MHGPAAAALAPILALISRPSFLSVAIIGAIAVAVYETRGLLRSLLSRSLSPSSRRTAKRPHLRRVNREAVVLDQDRRAAGNLAPAIVANVSVPERSAEPQLMAAAPSYLRSEIATPCEQAPAPARSIALVRDGNAARMERDCPGDGVTTAAPAMSRALSADAPDVTVAHVRPLELRAMSIRDQGRLLAFARRLPNHARIALAVDLNKAIALEAPVAVEAAATHAVVAYQDSRLVGYASLRRGDAPWTRHAGEICVVVGSTRKDEEIADCLGREMVTQALDAGLRRVTARTIDDPATRAIFARLGFAAEALLADHVIDEKGCTYDVLIMSGTRDQLVDAVPRELRVVAHGEIESHARDSDDASKREARPVALLAGVAHAGPSHTANAEVTFAHGHSRISSHAEYAPLAEPSLVSVSTGDALNTPGTPNTEQSTARPVPAALVRGHARPAPVRRTYLIAAMVGAILLLAFAGIYVASRHASPKKSEVLGAAAGPTVPATLAPGPAFGPTNVGSGGVFLAVVRPATTVRVFIDRDVVGTWFWCVESSFGMPLAEHFCAGASNSEPGPGELVSQGVIRIDPSWPTDAMYFVQMYCEGHCSWHAQVVSP